MKFRRLANPTLVLAIMCLTSCHRKSSQIAATSSTETITEIDPFAVASDDTTESQPRPKYNHGSEEFEEIVLFSKTDEPKVGLRVEILEPVVWVSATKANFTYRIANCTDDEVFVEVQDLQVVGGNYQGPEGFYGGGIGSGVGWPDNRILLKRLHSGPCACSMVEVSASTSLPDFASDQGKTTVSIRVTGFYRSTGKQFMEWIDLPFPLKC